jgi:hypothetical protein
MSKYSVSSPIGGKHVKKILFLSLTLVFVLALTGTAFAAYSQTLSIPTQVLPGGSVTIDPTFTKLVTDPPGPSPYVEVRITSSAITSGDEVVGTGEWWEPVPTESGPGYIHFTSAQYVTWVGGTTATLDGTPPVLTFAKAGIYSVQVILVGTDSGVYPAPSSAHLQSSTYQLFVNANQPTVIAADGGSRWSYQDASDATAKREGGYALFNDPGLASTYSSEGADYSIGGGWVDQSKFATAGPHGGYDTSTNKCKVCHAVHRAEGTYYLLRANSIDDACNYCHIDSPHSRKEVYTGNDAGIYTPNGHTMGASSRIPDSTVYQESVTVTLQGTSVKVRTYNEEKKQMFRVQWYGRSPLGHPTQGPLTQPQFGKTGPTPLNCSSCHQVHNATSQIWQPARYLTGHNSPYAVGAPDWKMTEGYKLLRRFPGATTTYGAGGWAGTTAIAKVPETTLVADQQFSTNFSKETTYVGIDDGLTWRQTDWVVGQDAWTGDAKNVTQGALSVWCADCHNLNIGTRGVVTGDAELGFGRAHAERTHPVPASRGFQCYSCHRSGMSAASGCNRCHYNTSNYLSDAAADLSSFGRPTDFPHAGADDEYKLLGAFSIASAPPATFPNTWEVVYTETAVGANNLDAVCIRCHTDQGVHQ